MKFKFLSLFDAKTNIYKINQIKIKKRLPIIKKFCAVKDKKIP